MRFHNSRAKRIGLSVLLALGLSSLAHTQPASTTSPRRFTLKCESPKAPAPPFPEWMIDVNLDLKTYYVDTQFGGPDEIASDDGNRLVLWRWRFGVHGLPSGSQEAFDRADGHYYFQLRTDGAPTPPDAICQILPPRAGFMADEKFVGPGTGTQAGPDAWSQKRQKWEAAHSGS